MVTALRTLVATAKPEAEPEGGTVEVAAKAGWVLA